MPSCCLIELEVVDEAIDLVVSDPDSLTIEDGEYIPYRTQDYDHYEGPYESEALFSEQTFATANKAMRQNFTVHAINYTEAPNDYGVTVTIGG